MRRLLALCLLLLTSTLGCGPSGTLATYNPTDDVVNVEVGSITEGIAAHETRTFRWSGSPFTVVVRDTDGALLEEVSLTPAKGDRWLFHHVGGDRCFGIADFGNLFVSGTDGSLSDVSALHAEPWSRLSRQMDVWPGQKLPLFSETPEVWGMVEISCGMTVDAANTHAAIQGVLHKLRPK